MKKSVSFYLSLAAIVTVISPGSLYAHSEHERYRDPFFSIFYGYGGERNRHHHRRYKHCHHNGGHGYGHSKHNHHRHDKKRRSRIESGQLYLPGR